MIKRIADYIDRNYFVQDVLNKVDKVDNIIVDSFVSNHCNLSCKHCYFLDYTPKQNPLSLDEWRFLFDQWIGKGVKHFHFSGKEPFCDNRVQILLSHLNLYTNDNLFYGLVTNGTVNPCIIESLLKTNLSYIEISIEGMSSFDDNIRGEKHFHTVECMLSRIEDKSKINLTTTIFKDNTNDLISFIRYFAVLGVNKFNFSTYLQFSKNILTPISELNSRSVLQFIRDCMDYLCSENELNNPIDIRVCLTETQCYQLLVENSFLSESIENYLIKGRALTFTIGKHILEISFPLLSIPFMSQLVITHDGYIISNADDIHFENIHEISLGNVRDINIDEIFIRRKEYINNYLNNELLK